MNMNIYVISQLYLFKKMQIVFREELAGADVK